MSKTNPFWSDPDKPTTSSAAMYPPSNNKPTTGPPGNGLTRFGSAPGSFLTRAVDSVIGNNSATSDRDFTGLINSGHHHHQQQQQQHQHHQYSQFSSGAGDSSCLTSESTCKVNSSNDLRGPVKSGLHRSSGFNEINGSLLRQKSSPAGFLSHHLSHENGFSITPGSSGGYNGGQRLKSQLSFTTQLDSLSEISEVSEDAVEGIGSDNGGLHGHNSSHSYSSSSGFAIGTTWDPPSSIVFSAPSSKRMKSIDSDFFHCLSDLETQASLEMATVEKLLNIPEDSVPCKIRAKRGCATHPRSIAERERRTRISGRLKKLQDLVPNMDKQTSYADMLDLAVQHIKGLQGEVQKLQKEMENCTCGCKPAT